MESFHIGDSLNIKEVRITGGWSVMPTMYHDIYVYGTGVKSGVEFGEAARNVVVTQVVR